MTPYVYAGAALVLFGYLAGLLFPLHARRPLLIAKEPPQETVCDVTLFVVMPGEGMVEIPIRVAPAEVPVICASAQLTLMWRRPLGKPEVRA